MKILVGTHNKDKLGQFKRIFAWLNSDIELLSLDDLGINDEVEEDRDSLLENAKKKARFYGEKSGFMTLSDDLGLFIDALNGEPGLHAKRWLSGTDKDRYMKVLERMNNVSGEKRTCRYKGVLAVYNHENKTCWTFESDLDGKISYEPKDGKGFGYDPIFIVAGDGRHYSEFSENERNKVSHRGLGVKVFLEHFGRLQ
jgi:XTP/dITP diphosphohydrolase